MTNTLNYNINFGIQNDNKVVAAVSNITASLVNVDKGIFKVDNAFGNVVTNIQNKISKIQISAILDQVDRFAGAMGNLQIPKIVRL